MNYEDRIFELYKIYIPIMYDHAKNYGEELSFKEVREYALRASFKAIEHFNNSIMIQGKQDGKRDNGND
jgi:hypothetical protein